MRKAALGAARRNLDVPLLFQFVPDDLPASELTHAAEHRHQKAQFTPSLVREKPCQVTGIIARVLFHDGRFGMVSAAEWNPQAKPCVARKQRSQRTFDPGLFLILKNI